MAPRQISRHNSTHSRSSSNIIRPAPIAQQDAPRSLREQPKQGSGPGRDNHRHEEELHAGLNAVVYTATSPDSNSRWEYSVPERTATGSSRRSSLVDLSLGLFGFTGGQWKKLLIFHAVMTILFNGYDFAISTYSAFFASCQSSPAQDLDLKMQYLISGIGDEKPADLEQSLAKLVELKEWEAFNQWVLTCAVYAKQDITSPDCQAALEVFDRPPPHLPNDSSHNLERRRIRELSQELQKATGVDVPILSGPYTPETGIIVPVFQLLLICLALVSLYMLLHKQARNVLMSITNRLRKHRSDDLVSEEKAPIADDVPQPVLIRSAVSDSDPGTVRRRNQSSSQMKASDVWTAASQGNLATLHDLFLQNNAIDINSIHPRHGTVVQAAAQSGKIEVLSYVLQRCPDVNLTGGHFHSPLQAGAYSGSFKVVNELLTMRASVHALGGPCGSPLHAAAERGCFQMVLKILDCGAKPNIQGGAYGYPLHAAASRGLTDVVSILLERGADFNAKGGQYTTALHAAVVERRLPVVKLLLEKNPDIDVISETYGTPLQVACRQGYFEIAVVLVEANADISLRDKDERTPLHDAARLGSEALTRALLLKGIDKDAADGDGWTALHHAALKGFSAIIKMLIDAGADVRAEDKFNAHALFRSAGMGHNEATKLLLQAGSPPNARDCFGRTALHGPAPGADPTRQRLLLEWGADINIVGDDKKTALHRAAVVGNLHVVKLLLSHPGVKTNLQDNDQKTPLLRAVEILNETGERSDHEKIALLLLEAPDVNLDARSGSALQEAIARNRMELVQEMLNRGASLILQGSRYGSAAQAAVRSGNIEMLALVIGKGAGVNIQGGEFGTALQAAAYFGNLEMIDLLLDSGANVNARGGKYGCVVRAAVKSGIADHVKRQVLTTLKESGGQDVPANTHEREDWKLGPSGWTWMKSPEWEKTEIPVDLESELWLNDFGMTRQ